VAFHHGFRGGAPVKTMAIPAASCPYLRAVQATADRAGEGWGDVSFTSDRKTWRPFAVQLRPKLATFELALRVAIPHVPKPVASQLGSTLRAVKLGRAKLDQSKSALAYLDRTNWAVVEGYVDLQNASDLVGTACGFTTKHLLAPPIPNLRGLPR